MIVPTCSYSGAKFSALRRHVASSIDPQRFVNLPYDFFPAWVDTTVFILAKRGKSVSWPRQERCLAALKTFPKRHKINISGPADRARHDRMVEPVERMLELNRRRGGLGPPAGARRAPLPVGGGDAAATELDREIAATDAEIDGLVYALYGITDGERRTIKEVQ